MIITISQLGLDGMEREEGCPPHTVEHTVSARRTLSSIRHCLDALYSVCGSPLHTVEHVASHRHSLD